jgi:large subunit ribosomal protein L6
MSRIGKQPIPVPDGVTVTVSGRTVAVEGPKGKLQVAHRPEVAVTYDESSRQIVVTRCDDQRQSRALHGLTRALVANMVTGVTKGFERTLEVVGVGYTARLQGRELGLTVGYADTRVLPLPEGVTVEVPSPTRIIVRGADKQAVGDFAARVRAVRKPEPYQGKGIRYAGEVVRRKAGKAFAGTGST